MENLVIILFFVMIFGGSAIWGITDTVLKHRRKMAEIKYGRSDREARLTDEKADLKDTVSLMQDRIAVLERIATDPARRTADEIERLR
jgi:hypothetical protein